MNDTGMNKAALVGILLACAAGGALWFALRSTRGAAAPPTPPPVVAPEPAAPAVEIEPVVRREPEDEREPAAEPPEKSGASSGALALGSAPPEPARAWPEPDEARVWLHVRDRRTGAELDPVFVVALDGARGLMSRPGWADESAEDLGSSPVPVAAPAPGAVRTFHARSPGYAWGRIEIGAAPEECFLDLDPAGDLRVLVTGGPRDPGTQVRVFGGEKLPLFESELGERDEIAVAELPAGPVEVVAQLGTVWDPREVGRAAAEIVPGATTSVELALEPLEPARWVPLAGSLVLPPEWDLADFRLEFTLQNAPLEDWDGEASVVAADMELRDPAAGLYLWDARDVQPGRYSVDLLEVGHSSSLVVGPEGARDVRIAIAPPCKVHLRCVDARTRESIPSGAVFWASNEQGDASTFQEVDGWDQELGCFVLLVPCGSIRVLHTGFGYRQRTMDFEVAPGGAELEFVLERQTGLRLALKEGAHEVPWNLRALPTLEPLDDQPPASAAIRERKLTMIAEAGRYLLRVPQVEGYEPVPDRIVEIEEGVLAELVIELVRRP